MPVQRRAKKGAKRASAKRSASPKRAAKAEGGDAVKAWIRDVKPSHRPIVRKFDAMVGETVPGVKRAIKWGTPFYGVSGLGWIVSVASFKNYVAINFFNGVGLTPRPPAGESKSMRRVNVKDVGEFDEKQIRSWLAQASTIKGWGKVG